MNRLHEKGTMVFHVKPGTIEDPGETITHDDLDVQMRLIELNGEMLLIIRSKNVLEQDTPADKPTSVC